MLLPMNAEINNIYKIFVYHKILKNTSETPYLPNIVEQWISNASLSFPREMQITPESHIWLELTSQVGWLSEEVLISRTLHDSYFCVAPFQTTGPVTTHSLLWLISPFLSAWRRQRLKCWWIWYLSLTHHLLLSMSHQTRAPEVHSSKREKIASRETTELTSSYKILLG